MLFGVSLKEYLSNFLPDFFFFADLVSQSNGWLNTVTHMIRLKKIEEIKADENISKHRKKILIEQWKANTIKYKEDLILFIKKEIKNFFTEILIILDNRGIILIIKIIEKKYNTFLHFIYRLAKL
jgi:hypothetical protein